jgi:SAM-dependent methyltransferase
MYYQEPRREAVYTPQTYEVATLEEAMAVTVTPERGTTTEERWQKETPYLVEDIGKQLGVGPETCVLDYGCGTGRIAKGLIDQYGCRVIGVDLSASMRLLAPEYVLSERFTVWSPSILDKMIAKGFRVGTAMSLWVIQHVFDANEVIHRLANILHPGGLFYTLNQNTRCVPTNLGWSDDGFDVWAGLRAAFQEESAYYLPEDVTTRQIASCSMVQVLRKPETEVAGDNTSGHE